MRRMLTSIRDQLDRFGILVSGLCVVHCLAGLLIVAGLGLGGGVLLAPEIHRIGLALAIVVGLLTIGIGVLRHGQLAPLGFAAAGLALMTAGLFVSHGPAEAAFTVCGVLLVAAAHLLNLRQTC